ncbi:NUDIX hydrolase [Neptunomonas japonica]|uniref:NUDIX hydrolase n=1 Tax=Neptunomonas japonica TaxID=417574 RepID=UPI000411CBDA|nr:NUDIX hydrolase [Neptunomonas japonica]
MKYCSECGNKVSYYTPEGDNRPRHNCHFCQTTHYSNPNIVAGCLPVYQKNKILLCKRAIEPRRGYWTLPAGYMENNESVETAALRETCEEANAEVNIISLYTLTSIVHASQVQMLFLAELPTLEFSSGIESLDVQLFSFDEIPWDQLAFQTIKNALTFYIEDYKAGKFPLHNVVLEAPLKQLIKLQD